MNSDDKGRPTCPNCNHRLTKIQIRDRVSDELKEARSICLGLLSPSIKLKKKTKEELRVAVESLHHAFTSEFGEPVENLRSLDELMNSWRRHI